MENCIYCTNIEKRHSIMIKVCDLPYAEIFLMRDQWHPGRLVVTFTEHKKEYFEMTPEENAGYAASLSKIAKVIYEIYSPQKINYLIMGDEMPHIHVHLVPKYKDLESWNGFANGRPQKFLTDEEYAEIIEKIKAKLFAE